jgi:hypothetical protein
MPRHAIPIVFGDSKGWEILTKSDQPLALWPQSEEPKAWPVKEQRKKVSVNRARRRELKNGQSLVLFTLIPCLVLHF